VARLYVTAIRWSQDGKRIEWYQVRTPTAESVLSQPATYTRHQLATAILNGTEVFTAKLVGGAWKHGAQVEIALRTHPDVTTADNLENLPKF